MITERHNKRVLVISPTPTHPQNAGNRARIFNLLNNIRSLGYEVHMVYDDLEYTSKHVELKPDIRAMRRAWDKFVYVHRGMTWLDKFSFFKKDGMHALIRLFVTIGGWVAVTIGTAGAFLKAHWPGAYRALKPFFPDRPDPAGGGGNRQAARPGDIDRWYNRNLDPVLASLSANRYDAVIAEYVFMSKSLEAFGRETLKIIDTHDVFSGRKEKYEKFVIEHGFFSTTEAEESKGLDRADRIIAIQIRERDILERLTYRPVYTVGHTVDLVRSEALHARGKVICIGAGSESNIHGVTDLIINALPAIRSRIPGFELVLVGKICDLVPDAEGCLKLGEVRDLEQVYDVADIALNPVKVGTGLKIKSIEALGRGKPLVTTAIGAEGLEDAIGKGIFIAESPAEYAEIISRLISDPSLYRRSVEDAYRFSAAYNEEVMSRLKSVLED